MALAQSTVLDDVLALHPYFRALASPVRLQLLWDLRVPKNPRDLRMHAGDTWGGLREGRALSRSTVRSHLAALEDLDLVTHLRGEEQLVVNRQRIYTMVRDLGALARIRPVVSLDVDHTVFRGPGPRDQMPGGPKLILVSGPEAGEAFPLRGEGPWTLGRGDSVDIRLAYDPHVSRVHLQFGRAEQGGHWVGALPGITNPAQLDFRDLEPGRPEPLSPGSILTAGSCSLVYRA